MNKLQIAKKILELMEKYSEQVQTTDTPIGYDFHYGPLTLDVLGNVYGEKLPSHIDVVFDGERIGRLDGSRPNPYYPHEGDTETLQVCELYEQICTKCRKDNDARKEKARASRELKFLEAK